MRFRKKPVVIEAVQFTGKNQREILAFMGGHTMEAEFLSDDIVIKTLEGDLRASPGDWVIRGVKGEHYPCKPDIFEATYERVEE